MADRNELDAVLDAIVRGLDGLEAPGNAKGEWDRAWNDGYETGLKSAAALIRAAKPKLRDAVSG